ncbi:MAG TPA: AAA family ATPase, partial [Clostridiales bacterium]|nr:AAA family ATPase [Clostridiales bacterium]
YMVDTSGKIDKIIKNLVDKGKYFTINRARQFGKTTTMFRLMNKLENKYIVIKTSFEGKSYLFKDEESFASGIFDLFSESFRFTDKETYAKLLKYGVTDMKSMKDVSREITRLCDESEKEIILMIDEVDKASNFVVFMDFIGELRDKYINAQNKMDKTFKSVILAGVSDIKNLKVHISDRRILTGNEAEKLQKGEYNSPWNVAADFDIDMSFNPEEIATMLVEYEKDYKTGMNIGEMSEEIYSYTSGYPFLVSKLCKTIDEKLDKNFTSEGLQEAIKLIIKEKNTLFDDLIKNIENNKDLYDTVCDIVIEGKEKIYNVDAHEKGIMYGIFKENERGKLAIHNKIFEIRIYNYMIAKEEEKTGELLSYDYRTNFIDDNGDLKLEIVLEKFQLLMKQEYREADKKFIEKQGRLLFLCFIRPIINGTGFYYVEPQTRQDNRMDVVITYNRKQYIIELKIWHGDKYEDKGIDQLVRYLDIQNEAKGYIVVFSFNKNKEYTREWVEVEGKRIYEVIV